MQFSKNSNGFSMIEVIVVLAIIGLLAMVARPSVKPFLEGIRLRTAANTIKQQLILAKTRALGDPNVHAGVSFKTTFPYSIVAFLDDDPSAINDYTYTANDHVLAPSYSLPKTDTLTLVSGANPIVFRGDGSAKARAIFFIYYNYKGVKRGDTISVLASTGRIRITRNF